MYVHTLQQNCTLKPTYVAPTYVLERCLMAIGNNMGAKRCHYVRLVQYFWKFHMKNRAYGVLFIYIFQTETERIANF